MSYRQERRRQLIWQITEPLLPLMEEDRDSLEHSAERTERCEQLLLQILDLAQQKPESVTITPKAPQPSSLF